MEQTQADETLAQETSTKAGTRGTETWPSPRFLLVRALTLGVLFFLVHLAGLREYTAFLSGTAAAQTSMGLSVFYGMVYIVLYLGAVVLAPILVFAAGILILWQKRAAR